MTLELGNVSNNNYELFCIISKAWEYETWIDQGVLDQNFSQDCSRHSQITQCVHIVKGHMVTSIICSYLLRINNFVPMPSGIQLSQGSIGGKTLPIKTKYVHTWYVPAGGFGFRVLNLPPFPPPFLRPVLRVVFPSCPISGVFHCSTLFKLHSVGFFFNAFRIVSVCDNEVPAINVAFSSGSSLIQTSLTGLNRCPY